VKITGPCIEQNYVPDRLAIPVIPDLTKYVIAADGDKFLSFNFNFTPSSCSYWKVYTLEAETYVGKVKLATIPWATVDEGQAPGKVKIRSDTPSHEDYYKVTVKSKLY
jgi:hypothetical protein